VFAHPAVAAVYDQTCPNYDQAHEGRPAASPLAVRKGCAFPWREAIPQPHPRRREGIAFPAARMRKNSCAGPEGQNPSAQQSGEAASKTKSAR